MRIMFLICLLSVLTFVTAACKSGDKGTTIKPKDLVVSQNPDNINDDDPSGVVDPPYNIRFVKPGGFNCRIVIVDPGITDPSKDRRSYYRIFVNKEEVGRTTTGLESQEKTAEFNLDANRHLLQVEKYVLDEKKGRYEKLNNIDQPKPNFLYFDAESGRITEINIIHDGASRYTEYTIDFVKEK